jgi:hypothetical protein
LSRDFLVDKIGQTKITSGSRCRDLHNLSTIPKLPSLESAAKSFTAKFIRCDCNHVPRECNKAAHVLATFGVGSTEGIEHISCVVPDSVSVIMDDDLSARVQ